MIIQTITAESIKCFKNEVQLGDIKKLGGIATYLSHFFRHMKGNCVESLALETLRINEEVPAELTALIEHHENDLDAIKPPVELTDETELVVVYHAYSDIHQLYYLSTEEKILQGLECESFSLPVNSDYQCYLPFVSDGTLITPLLQFSFVNSEEDAINYKYPGISVFEKQSGQLITDAECWNDCDFDIVEPEEQLFLKDPDTLCQQLAEILSPCLGI